MELKEKLVALRKEKGLTQLAVAEKLMFPDKLFHGGNRELPCHLQTILDA